MLSVMRKYATSWMIKFILGAIVVVFVFWGVGSFRSQKANRVALVNGEPITLAEYRETYDRLVQQLRGQFGNNFNDSLLEMLQVKKQALNQLIDQRLILDEAQRLKFRVTDSELAQSIQNIKAFQYAGIFNDSLYKRILSRNRMTPEQFEALQRKSMLLQRIQAFVESGAKVSEPEALDWYEWENKSVNVDYVQFKPDRYKDIKVDEKEVETYFEKNKEAYKREPKVKVRYIYFDPAAYEPLITIPKEEIKSYYEDHMSEFEKPATVEARHILFAVDQNAAPKVVEEAREKALKVLKLAKSGKDFAELAKEYSDGPTGKTGGYLGTFKREDMVKPFADKAFSMKPGEISGPVRTKFGWHLIKVEKVNPARTISFAEAEAQIRKKLTEDRAKTMAYDDADATFELTLKIDDLAKVASTKHLKLVTTDYFTQQQPPKDLKDGSKFAAAAFSLDKMEISDVQDFGDGYYITQLLSKIPASIPPLSAVSAKVRADVIKEKQKEKARQDAAALLAALKSGKPLQQEVRQYGLSIGSTGFFKRNEQIPTIGYEPEIAQTAFSLSAKKRLPDEVVEGAGSSFVIIFKAEKAPDPADFKKEKEQIMSNLLMRKRTEIFSDWLAEVRKKSKIQVEMKL